MLDADAVVLLEWKGSPRPEFEKPLAHLYSSGEIKGKPLEFTLLHGLDGFKARRILIAGAGKREKFDAAALRKLAGAAVRFLDGKGIGTLAFSLDDAGNHMGNNGANAPEHITAVVEGAILGAWEPDYLKTDKEEKNKPIASLVIAVPSRNSTLEAALEKGRIIAEAGNLSRDISVEPPNLLTPLALADRARRMAETCGLSFEVLDRDRMRQLGMGALLGVAQGSAAPPALIVMRYMPGQAGFQRPSRPCRQRRNLRYRRHFHQTFRRHGEDEVRHGGRRGGNRRHAGHRPSQAAGCRYRACSGRRKHARQPRPAAR